ATDDREGEPAAVLEEPCTGRDTPPDAVDGAGGPVRHDGIRSLEGGLLDRRVPTLPVRDSDGGPDDLVLLREPTREERRQDRLTRCRLPERGRFHQQRPDQGGDGNA